VTAAVGGKNGQTTVRAVALPSVTIALTGSTQPEAGTATTFTVTPNTTTNGNPLREVVVDFGDGARENLGAISAATQVSHVYARAGQYRVTATATDIQGLTSSSSLVIQVNDRSSLAVTMTATPNPVSVSNVLQQGLVEFNAIAAGATGIQFYQWDFGDGGSAFTTGNNTNHRYTAPGNYTARVTVRASNGQEGFSERTIRVNP
jgi:PKD repeat protein